jgi:hypothetical protein
MKVMFDTNVLLDALLEREPYAKTAAKLLGAAAAKKLAQRLLKIFDLATVDRVMLQAALGSPDHDFEDAVLWSLPIMRAQMQLLRAILGTFSPHRYGCIHQKRC